MHATIALFRNELRLLLRNPAVVIWTILIPIAALVVMCLIPSAREPLPNFGGLSVIESYQPTLIVFAATMLALQMMPMFIGQYRELGFLRRLRTTPAHPRDLLAAILALILTISLVVGLVLLTFPLLFGVGVVGRLARPRLHRRAPLARGRRATRTLPLAAHADLRRHQALDHRVPRARHPRRPRLRACVARDRGARAGPERVVREERARRHRPRLQRREFALSRRG